ncbi:putative ankyrin repeat protein RF_0381 [Microplitis mediator]|uniref:putative ankyrin repeat protein RF_0381 n=1 Tax=Microplitis mediator TaxID=375433 RepID=UPI002556FAF4|nr:putative ankyrin repeat protein RF_0381 [Microplitis mediator]
MNPLIFDKIDRKIVQDLLASGVDINTTGNYRENDSYTVLHAAVDSCDRELIEFILSNKANINALTSNYAPVDSDDELDSKDSGREKNRKTYSGYSPLHVAVRNDSLEIVKLLLSNGADVHAKLTNCHTVLNVAIETASLELIKCLLEFGADVNQISVLKADSDDDNNDDDDDDILPSIKPKSYTPLHVAAELGRFDVIKVLINNGADPNAEAVNNQSVLYHAVCGGNYEIVDYLLEHGADVNRKNDVDIYLDTPCLIFAIEKDRFDIVKLLVSYGADNNDDGQAVRAAVEKGDFEIVRFLIDHNFKVNTLNAEYDDLDNVAPLYAAIDGGSFNMMELLLLNGANIDDARTTENIFNYRVEYDTPVMVGKHVLKTRTLKEYAGDLENVNFDASKVDLPPLPYDHECEDDVIDDNFIQRMYRQQEKEYIKMCEKEIEKMEIEFIGTSDVSYYDLLRKNIHQLTMCARNNSIRDTIFSDKMEENFPIYAGIIINCFQKGFVRKELLDKVEQLLADIFLQLSREFIEEIFSYLKNEDVKHFIRYL